MATTQEPASYFSMPGAFHSEGVHPGLIRPPSSAAVTSNSAILSSAVLTPGSPSSPSALPRPNYKRRRPGDGSSAHSNPSTAFPRNGYRGPEAGFQHRRDATTQPSRDNTFSTSRSYVLAGDLATPGAVNAAAPGIGPDISAEQGTLGDSMFSDSDYRTVLGSKRRRDEIEPDPSAPPTLYTLPSYPSQKSQGWGSYAFSTLGGVVGKVWDFCWGSTFRGFHAGNGRGYDAHIITSEAFDSAIRNVPGSWNIANDGSGAEQAQPVPDTNGDSAHADYTVSASSSRSSTPTRQPAKRRQTAENDDLGRNWVVVKPSSSPNARASPARPSIACTTSTPRSRKPAVPISGRRTPSASNGHQARNVTPTSRMAGRRSASRGGRQSISMASGWEKPPMASTASFASPRSSSAASYREPSIRNDYEPSSPARRRTTVAASVSHIGVLETRPTRSTPSRNSHRRSYSNASAASPRSPHATEDAPRGFTTRREASDSNSSDSTAKKQSPRLTEEARRLAAKRKMEERDADVRMAAFNRRLQDMIRQGKEALGTTVDVEMEGPTEGAWEDDE